VFLSSLIYLLLVANCAHWAYNLVAGQNATIRFGENIKKIETNYAKNRGLNNNGHKEIHYECNRSDIKGKNKKNNLHDYEVFFKDLKARQEDGEVWWDYKNERSVPFQVNC
jgi:hypothetical protein